MNRAKQFYLYAADERADKEDSRYEVVKENSESPREKDMIIRLRYSHLGFWADIQRLLSEKHRILYIDPIPSPQDTTRAEGTFEHSQSSTSGTGGLQGWMVVGVRTEDSRSYREHGWLNFWSIAFRYKSFIHHSMGSSAR